MESVKKEYGSLQSLQEETKVKNEELLDKLEESKDNIESKEQEISSLNREVSEHCFKLSRSISSRSVTMSM